MVRGNYYLVINDCDEVEIFPKNQKGLDKLSETFNNNDSIFDITINAQINIKYGTTIIPESKSKLPLLQKIEAEGA